MMMKQETIKNMYKQKKDVIKPKFLHRGKRFFNQLKEELHCPLCNAEAGLR